VVNDNNPTPDPDAPEQEISEVDWSAHSEVPGLEHLGKAIVDDNGQPSGSPANYERTRGSRGAQDLPNVSELVTAINAEFAAAEGS
jgi:hypothetical protein